MSDDDRAQIEARVAAIIGVVGDMPTEQALAVLLVVLGNAAAATCLSVLRARGDVQAVTEALMGTFRAVVVEAANRAQMAVVMEDEVVH